MDFNENASLDSSLVRGVGGGGGGGGKFVVGGLGGVIVLILSLIFGINPGDVLGGDTQQPTQNQAPASDPYANCTSGASLRDNRDCRFTAYANSIDHYWSQALKGYTPVETDMYSGSYNTACGTASNDVGPFYCPSDKKIYMDTTFFDELQNRFGAKGGDAAEFYVLAHETGHHVQDLLGTLDKVHQAGNQTGPTSPSVRLELQADCYGGVAMKHVLDDPNGPIKNLTQDDLDRAVDAAQAVGDDRIQKRASGRVDRESWTHGSAANRKYWLAVGFNGGDPNKCTTFNQNAPQIG